MKLTLFYLFQFFHFILSSFLRQHLFIHIDCREFVGRLRDEDKQVYLITGGFDCLIEPVAQELGIPLDHMFANKLFFHYNGACSILYTYTYTYINI